VTTVAAPSGATVAAPSGRWGRFRKVPPVVWVFLLIPAVVEVGMVFWPALNSFYLYR
jgi:multiple sugar transport system permease protein